MLPASIAHQRPSYWLGEALYRMSTDKRRFIAEFVTESDGADRRLRNLLKCALRTHRFHCTSIKENHEATERVIHREDGSGSVLLRSRS